MMRPMMRPTPIGALDGLPPAFVDGRGAIGLPDDLRAHWHVRSEARGHDPRADSTVRQTVDAAIVETTMRVAGGEARHRAYGTGAGRVVIEIDNDSSAAFAVAIVLSDADRLDEVGWTYQPARSCTAADVDAVYHRLTVDDTEVGIGSRGGAIALVWPVSHRGSLRVTIGAARADPASVAGAEEVRRAWRAHLRRGMRVEIDDRALGDAIDQARVALLVESGRADAETTRALEDWGFDAEAASAWDRLGAPQRARLRRRRADPATAWTRARHHLERNEAALFLNAMREVLALDRRRSVDAVDLLPGFPPDWLGLGVGIHDAPARCGAHLSAALRWHGDRPALLWETSSPITLRCPRFDSGFSTRACAGEVLLPSRPRELLGLS